MRIVAWSRGVLVLAALALGAAACGHGAAGTPSVTTARTTGTEVRSADTATTAASGSTGPAAGALTFAVGRNDYSVTVDGTKRTFIVHVPSGYRAGTSTSVVFVFHGTNQDGELFWNQSGWKEKAEAKGFLVVFPTAAVHPTTDEGSVTKWNDTGLRSKVKAGSTLADDVAFVRAILDRAAATWTVDRERIFATGFSSGSGFVATRLMMEMPDTFASFGLTPGTLSSGDEPFTPSPLTAKRSVFITVGTEDEKAFGTPQGKILQRDFPSDPAVLLAEPYIQAIYGRWFSVLAIDPGTYTVSDGRPGWRQLTFTRSTAGGGNEIRIRFVKGMPHWYPWPSVATQYGFSNCDIFWDFFQAHPLGR